MTDQQHRSLIRNARLAVADAERTRARLRRRSDPRGPSRRIELSEQIVRLRYYGGQIRAQLGRAQFMPGLEHRHGLEYRRASAAVQRERHKLLKMARKGGPVLSVDDLRDLGRKLPADIAA